MDGRYDEYPEQARQRPGYPARPDGQRQGPAQRGPGQDQPGQDYPGQDYPGQGYLGQGYPGQGYQGPGQQGQGQQASARQPTPPRAAAPRGTTQRTPPRGTPQPWNAGPQQPGGDPWDQRSWDARDPRGPQDPWDARDARGSQDPWDARGARGSQSPRDARDARGSRDPWEASRDQGARYQASGRTGGFDAVPGSQGEAFLPGWDGDDQGGHDEGFWDGDDRGRGRGKRGQTRGARASTRDHDDYYDEDDDYGRPPRRRRSRWMAPLVALLVVAGVIVVPGYFAYSFYMSKYHPADYSGSGYGSVLVQVPGGATPTSLAPELQRLGVVQSSRAFVLAAEHSTSTSTLEVGFFKLHMHMQASLVWATLINPKNMVQTLVTFPEGLRAASIVSLLGQHTAISLSDYQAAIKNTAALGLPSYANGKPEGYLFPSQYQITPHETALQVLQAMVTRYKQEAQTLHLTTAATPMHLSTSQLMIVASLVQAEGGRLSDYPKIASVVYNRLKAHMKLQFDSTVLYGLGKFGTRASDADLTSTSPYNSYKYTGLPPTPIDNPGVAAIEAALKPASTNYLYFLSFKNGSTEFSATPITG